MAFRKGFSNLKEVEIDLSGFKFIFYYLNLFINRNQILDSSFNNLEQNLRNVRESCHFIVKIA